MNGIIRVFPTKTNFSPKDDYTFFGSPGLFIPEHKAVHISCTFTWDIPKALKLQPAWQFITKREIFISGPAFNNEGSTFTPGMYLKKGITITSRGCSCNCSFCFVPKREGRIRELPINEGNIILDNNLLACSDQHVQKVFEMLRKQKRIEFNSGLEASRITDKIVNDLRSLSIKYIWLAYDSPDDFKPLQKAVSKLIAAGFKRDHLRVYCLVGYQNDTIENAKHRLQAAYKLGTKPVSMLFRSSTDGKLSHSKEWIHFHNFWSKPSIYVSVMKKPELLNTCKNYTRFKNFIDIT